MRKVCLTLKSIQAARKENCEGNKLSPRWRQDDIPSTDGSSTRGGSTSVRGRVRDPHISDGRPTAGSQRAYSLGWDWDRQTDRQTDGRIAVSLNAPPPYGG